MDFFRTELRRSPALAILRGMTRVETVEVVHHCASLGIRLIEVPLQSDESVAALDAAVAAGADLDLVVGSGTARSVEDVRIAHDHGARFTVAPGFDFEVAAESVRLGMPHLPGVATPTEVHRAALAGFTVQKCFPASVLGTGWVEAMRGPFPDVDFIVTGGIDQNNADRFLRAGALGVAFGSSIRDVRQVPERSSR
jgi:2-dehydro-3-deoxyphosphogluconate aldolase/(4S)-4-hydroxy-2-oxoglutarate aldolase